MEGEVTTTNVSQVIIDTINNLLNTLFASIDNSAYNTLDELTFIDNTILNNSLFEKLFSTTSNNSLILICNSLLIAVCIYYCFKLMYSHFSGIQIERPYQFIFKLLIFTLFINSSYFICELFIYFNSLFSDSVREIGQNILGEKICFSSLIENLNSTVTVDSPNLNVFSFNGLIKSLVSISFMSLLFSYSLRYIMLKVFILLTPFALLSLINNSSSWFFKSWLKIFISLLFIQPFISIILIIIFALDFTSPDVTSKILCIGSLYALIRTNSFVQHFIGGISTDVSQNFKILRNQIK